MLKLQIGAGLDGPTQWLNVDASPTLRLQRLPVLGSLFQHVVRPRFSPSIVYGDVVRGLNLKSQSAEIVYSSHVLEHLSLEDFTRALLEIRRAMRPGGIFRSVMPDLEYEVQRYLHSDANDRASDFLRATLLGQERRKRGVTGALRSWIGNSQHLWLWNYRSLAHRLAEAGFTDIRRATFNDSSEPAFIEVENPERWQDCLGFECKKPVG